MHCSGHLQKLKSCESQREKTEHVCAHVCVYICLYQPYLERDRERCTYIGVDGINLSDYQPIQKKCNTTSDWDGWFLETLLGGRSFLLCHPYLWDTWLSTRCGLTVCCSGFLDSICCLSRSHCIHGMALFGCHLLKMLWVIHLIPGAE